MNDLFVSSLQLTKHLDFFIKANAATKKISFVYISRHYAERLSVIGRSFRLSEFNQSNLTDRINLTKAKLLDLDVRISFLYDLLIKQCSGVFESAEFDKYHEGVKRLWHDQLSEFDQKVQLNSFLDEAYNLDGYVLNAHYLEYDLKKKVISYLALKDPDRVNENIPLFHLEDNDRFALAHLIANHTPCKIKHALTGYITNYQLNHDQRLIIADILSDQGDLALIEFFDRLQIETESDRERLALKLASFRGGNFSEYFDNFNISEDNRKARVQLAEKQAKADPRILIDNFEKYSLTKEEALPILKLLAIEGLGEYVLTLMEMFDLNPSELLDLIQVTLENAPPDERFHAFIMDNVNYHELVPEIGMLLAKRGEFFEPVLELKEPFITPIVQVLAVTHPEIILRILPREEIKKLKEREDLACTAFRQKQGDILRSPERLSVIKDLESYLKNSNKFSFCLGLWSACAHYLSNSGSADRCNQYLQILERDYLSKPFFKPVRSL
jgi:hypothetical protein